MRRFSAIWAAVLVVSLSVAFAVNAQEQATPSPGTATPTTCATSMTQAEGSPVSVAVAPSAVASPGGVAPGTAIALFPCGSATASPASMTGQAQSGQQTVEMVDIAFNPKEITIPANTDVTIALVNNGVTTHSFNVDELNVHSGDYQPGQTGTVTINAQPGTYQYYCAIPGHKEAGMVGTITVQ